MTSYPKCPALQSFTLPMSQTIRFNSLRWKDWGSNGVFLQSRTFLFLLWDNLKPNTWTHCLQNKMALIFVTTWEYDSKSIHHLHCYPPESPATIHTVLIQLRNPENQQNKECFFFENNPLETLSWMRCFLMLLLFLLHLLVLHLKQTLQAKPLKVDYEKFSL